jgi:hypothetical protein
METDRLNQNRETLIDRVTSGIAKAAALSIKYAIPLAAGFYVGIKDGYHQEIDPSRRYVLLTAPTAIDVGFTFASLKIGKHFARNPPEPIKKFLRDVNPEEREYALNRISELKNMDVTARTVKRGSIAAILTTTGYVVGSLCSQLA